MAAVRCAARRLGGALLQRTQAAVAEEGRLLAPSRLMRSRHLSTKVSGGEATMAAARCAARRLGGSLLQRTQAAVAEEGPRLVPSRFMRSGRFASEGKKVEQAAQKKTELHDALLKARKNRKGEHDEQLLQYLHRRKVVPEPDDAQWQKGRFATRVNSVLEGLGRMTFYVGITALAVGVTSDKGVQA